MIKNYIFDFGNVLARFDPYMLSKAHIEDEKIAKTAKHVICVELSMGQMIEDVKLAVECKVPVTLSDFLICWF